MHRTSRLIGGFVCLSLLGSLSTAQETRASLSGIVSDVSGSVVPGTAMKLTNVDTGVTLSTSANETGLYRFLFLDPGKYRLDATATGFKGWERGNIELTVNLAATLPVVLEVGAQTEKITVSGEAPLIEAEKADHGMVIDNKKVVDIPINTRNPIMLAAMSNGIVHTSGTTLDQKPFSNSADGSWSINGGVGSTVEFLLDGAPNNTIYNGVSTVANRALGRRGAGIQGDDEHLRRAVRAHRRRRDQHFAQERHQLAARLGLRVPEARSSSMPRPSRTTPTAIASADQRPRPVRLHRRRSGAHARRSITASDKTFFFFAWEKYHEDQEYPSEKVASVPTQAQRQGDFSDTRDNADRLITIYDPAGKADASKEPSGCAAVCRTTSFRPTASTPVARRFLALYPLPNTISAGLARLAEQLLLGRQHRQVQLHERHAPCRPQLQRQERVYARWSWSDFNQVRNANAIHGDWRRSSRRRQAEQRRRDRFRHHAEFGHAAQHARGAFLLEGADRTARISASTRRSGAGPRRWWHN